MLKKKQIKLTTSKLKDSCYSIQLPCNSFRQSAHTFAYSAHRICRSTYNCRRSKSHKILNFISEEVYFKNFCARRSMLMNALKYFLSRRSIGVREELIVRSLGFKALVNVLLLQSCALVICQ